MNLAEKLGRQISMVRKSKGWTGEELGRRCGVQKAQISRAEKDITHASTEVLLKICEAFGSDLFLCEDIDESQEMQQFIQQYQAVMENSMSWFWAKKILRQSTINIRKLILSNEFEYEQEDHDIVMEKLYGLTNVGDKIHAISFDEISDWKSVAMGRQYLDLNSKAVSRGVDVERIFIYSNHMDMLVNKDNVFAPQTQTELISLDNIIDQQQKGGIKVRIVDATMLGKDHCQSRIIFITRDHGKFTTYPVHNKEGMFVKSYVSWDETKAGRFERIYQTIRSSSCRMERIVRT